jgi:predicted nucleic acid-binding protein
VLIISDTNILGSFAAGEALPLLFRLFSNTTIQIPPAVRQELQTGLTYGQTHLESILQAIDGRKLQILHLSENEQSWAHGLPKKLNAGEREAIALSKNRQGQLLSNDKQVVRYCRQNNIKIADLPLLLRLLWTRKIVSQDQVRTIIDKMKDVENLQMSQKTLAIIFALR